MPGERGESHTQEVGRVRANWLDTPAVQRAAVRRRRRRAGLIGASVLAVAAAVVVPVVSVSSSSAPPRPPARLAIEPGVHVGARLDNGVQLVADNHPLAVADPAAAMQVSRAEQSFSVALLKQLGSSAATDTNLSVSPASLGLALSMLQNGASGATLTQIQKTLQTVDLSTQQQDAGWQSLVAEWNQFASHDKADLSSANSLFVQSGFPILQPFLASLGEYYDAGTWQVDFHGHLADALKTINTWTAQQTHGKITKLFEPGQVDASLVAVLANAVYFKAPWQEAFDSHQSAPGDFHTPGGVTHPTFMTSSADAPLTGVVTADYQAAQLPYYGGHFAAMAVMPTSGSLASFVSGLGATQLNSIATAAATARATVSLPKFTTSSSNALGSALAALGMPTAFTPSADFSRMSPVALSIQAVEQRVYLKVNETGSEAAAATGIGMIASAAEGAARPIVFDRPFLFLIRDTQTGAILFASEINNPQD